MSSALEVVVVYLISPTVQVELGPVQVSVFLPPAVSVEINLQSNELTED